MLQIIADTHTHSLACDHAYSTIAENMAAAKTQGLKFVASTEHTPLLPGAPTELYFSALHILPRFWDGVMLLKGAEVNIMDYAGRLDLSDSILERMEWVVASMHGVVLKPATSAEHTAGWLAVAENPLVDVIGHCGEAAFLFEHEPVVKAFAQNGKIVEINSHSFAIRAGAKENCAQIAKLCAQYRVPVVVSSDAHFCSYVGRFDSAVKMLEEISFPQELILNADYNRFLRVAQQKSGRNLIDEE